MKSIIKVLRTSEVSAALAIVILSLFFYAFNPNFLTPENITTVLRSAAYVGIVAVGMAFCLISGLIDISVGGMVAMVNCFAAWLLVKQGVPPLIVVPAAFVLGSLAAIMNVTIIIRLGINPFIATIASMYIMRGVAYWISEGYSIYPLPAGMAETGNLQIGGLTIAFLVFAALVVIGQIVIDNTVWGLMVRATGSDRETARDTEVDVNLVNYSCFLILGLCGAISALLLMLRTNGGIATAGLGMEFRAILGCALGGVSLFGYDGSIVGAALGVLLAQVIANGLIAAGLPIEFQDIVLGSLLVAVIAIDISKQKIRTPVYEEY